MLPRLLLLTLGTAGLLLPGSVWAQEEANADQLARLQTSIDKVKAELAITRNQRSEVAEALQANEQAILKVQQALRGITERIQTTEAELTTLQTRASVLEAQRQEQQALISDYMMSAHSAGSGTSLKLLLNQDDPALGSRMLRYYEYFSAARGERLASYRETLATMAEVSANISANSEELEAEHIRLTEEGEQLTRKLVERQNLLDDLDVTIVSRGDELATLEQQRQEIEAVLEEIRSSITNLNMGDADTPFAERKGQLPWPLEGRVLNSFGSKHSLGDLTWEGMTLEAEAGAEVRAIHHGRVVFADWLGSSGQLLIIDHGDGFMSLYAHNQELYKTVGDWVSGGEQIAAVGNTGGQRSNALYFEIRSNGKAENPVNWCVARR